MAYSPADPRYKWLTADSVAKFAQHMNQLSKQPPGQAPQGKRPSVPPRRPNAEGYSSTSTGRGGRRTRHVRKNRKNRKATRKNRKNRKTTRKNRR